MDMTSRLKDAFLIPRAALSIAYILRLKSLKPRKRRVLAAPIGSRMAIRASLASSLDHHGKAWFLAETYIVAHHLGNLLQHRGDLFPREKPNSGVTEVTVNMLI